MTVHTIHEKISQAFDVLAFAAIAAQEANQLLGDTYEAIYQAERDRNALRAGKQWQLLNQRSRK